MFATAVFVASLLSAPAFADDLTRAKQLYDAADYDAVVIFVDSLAAGADGLEVGLREYRALSLLALNRPADAERETAAILDTNPLYNAAVTASQRWKALVDRVRARVWPDLIRRRYDSAKQSFDSRSFAKAVPELEGLQVLLAAAQKGGVTGLDDLVTLTDGFLQLSRTALQPSAPTSAPAPTSPIVGPPIPATVAEVAVVKPPVAIRRAFPAWDPPAGVPRWQALEGRIAVVVGADGVVNSARIVDSVHPIYDSLLMTAAKKWRFESATRNGEPIQYEIEVAVVLNSSQTGK